MAQKLVAQNLAYIVPRAVLVLLGLATTYWLLTALSPHLPPKVIYITSLAWLFAGLGGFGYLYRLRREAGLPPSRPIRPRQKAT